MTQKQGGKSAPVMETYTTLYDGFRDDIGDIAVPLTANVRLECFQVIIQSESTNNVILRVGTATSQSIQLQAGQTETLPFSGYLSEIYVRAPGGANQRINFHAMR